MINPRYTSKRYTGSPRQDSANNSKNCQGFSNTQPTSGSYTSHGSHQQGSSVFRGYQYSGTYDQDSSFAQDMKNHTGINIGNKTLRLHQQPNQNFYNVDSSKVDTDAEFLEKSSDPLAQSGNNRSSVSVYNVHGGGSHFSSTPLHVPLGRMGDVNMVSTSYQ